MVGYTIGLYSGIQYVEFVGYRSSHEAIYSYSDEKRCFGFEIQACK